ncbi:ABC transporter permease [Caldisalinibacter kiritimatiensis]|uniref:Unspecified monosaccharide ABC transport system, permease component 2 n=1 Tax=Caldisalinibacter kiritimatiensis TaxID=1304284 RepID=R1CSD0_9FIRM|nr:ABC transporter permease [Caldisalinibacter kiritimatiensis]EOC99613.1 Unspecified monosaccharide ABC transport system, permease component 2 [Caldisalinibacter kiritimatiensis]
MLNSLAFIIGTTLMYSTPLIYTALGGVVSENSGVVNIGLEGMMTIGAFIGATVGYYSGNPWLAFLAAGIAGGVLALLHAVASVTFAADQVVSGIAINFLGAGISLFLSRMFFSGSVMTKPISLDHKMPRPFNNMFAENSFFDLVLNQYATVYLAFILVLVLWYVLYKTKLGLRIRAVGEHPRAADTLGIDVFKIRYLAVILSGVFAGFGGAAMSLAIVSNFRPTLISGHGFIALAAMIFGKWRPQGAMWACLLFGAAQGIAVYLGSTGIQIPTQLLSMLPYVLTLLILMGFVGKATAPAADGVPYEKGGK